ncbi:unnamed protein product, partial [Sphacelaria rigidula]
PTEAKKAASCPPTQQASSSSQRKGPSRNGLPVPGVEDSVATGSPGSPVRASKRLRFSTGGTGGGNDAERLPEADAAPAPAPAPAAAAAASGKDGGKNVLAGGVEPMDSGGGQGQVFPGSEERWE